MTWLSEYEIENIHARFFCNKESAPNLYEGAVVLTRLMGWTNSCSDGWAYWTKPSRSAAKLSELLQNAYRTWYTDAEMDVTEAQLKATFTPIKAFLTRHGAEPAEKAAIFEGIS